MAEQPGLSSFHECEFCKDWNIPMRADIEEAISVMKRGDEDARERAVALLQEPVFAFSMRICGHRQSAEDIMQEVLLKSLPYLKSFQSSKALAVWLYEVAKNCCLMSRRRSKFAPKAELSLEDMLSDRADLGRIDGRTSVSPEEAAIQGEQRKRLRDAVQLLPPHYSIVVELHDLNGLKDEEVGEILGLRVGAVRVRLHRARLLLRNELSRRDEYRDTCATHLDAATQSGKSGRNGARGVEGVPCRRTERLSNRVIVAQLASLAAIWRVVEVVTADLISA